MLDHTSVRQTVGATWRSSHKVFQFSPLLSSKPHLVMETSRKFGAGVGNMIIGLHAEKNAVKKNIQSQQKFESRYRIKMIINRVTEIF